MQRLDTGGGREGGGALWKQDLRRRGVALKGVRREGDILSRDPGKEGGEMLSEAPGKEGVPFFPEENGAGVPKTPLHFIASGLGLSFRIVSVCSTVSTYAYRDAVLLTSVKRLAGQR